MEHESRARELAAYSFLVAFANDRTIDEHELAMLKRLALEDHVVDEEERKVLRNILMRIPESSLTEVQMQEIESFRRQFHL